MFYNINTQNILPRVPKNLIKPDGSIFINFHINGASTLADYGFYTIRYDNSDPPDLNHTEDISQRVITLDKPYADIIRVWTARPEINTNDTIILPETQQDSMEL